MSEESSWITCHVELESALPGQCLKDRDGVRILAETAKTHLVGAVLGLLSSPETHLVDLFVATGGAHKLAILRVVHVNVRGREPLPGVVDLVVAADWAVVELVDIAGVEVPCNVEHLFFVFI